VKKGRANYGKGGPVRKQDSATDTWCWVKIQRETLGAQERWGRICITVEGVHCGERWVSWVRVRCSIP
jgi:hypothetical protein